MVWTQNIEPLIVIMTQILNRKFIRSRLKFKNGCAVIVPLAVLLIILHFSVGYSLTPSKEPQRKREITDISPGNISNESKFKVDMNDILSSLHNTNNETLLSSVPKELTNCDLLFKNQKPVDLELSDLYAKTLTKLDKILKPYKGRIEGFSASLVELTQTYQTVAHMKTVKTVCETGFNAGHSALLFLSARSDIHMYSFDLGSHGYSKPGAKLLQESFPGRLNMTWGNSMKTLITFKNVNPDIKCDIIIVDGGHSYEVAKADLVNFKSMARKESNILIIDDYPCEAYWCPPVRKAWEEQLEKRALTEHFKCTSLSKKKRRGFAIGKYLGV